MGHDQRAVLHPPCAGSVRVDGRDKGDGDGVVFCYVLNGVCKNAIWISDGNGRTVVLNAVDFVIRIGGNGDLGRAAVFYAGRVNGHIAARAALADAGGDGVGQLLEGDGNGAVPFDGVGVGTVCPGQRAPVCGDAFDLPAFLRQDGEGEHGALLDRVAAAFYGGAVHGDCAALADAGGDGVENGVGVPAVIGPAGRTG